MKKLLFFLLPLLVLLALASLWFISDKHEVSQKPQKDLLDFGRVEREDKQILNDLSKGSQYQIHAALIRRSKKGDEMAKKRALELLDHPSEWVRSGAFHALGHLSDDLTTLQQGLKDPSPKVQKHTLRGLSEVRSQKRKEVIENFSSEDGNPLVEAERLRALIKQTSDSLEKDIYIANLIKLYNDQTNLDASGAILRILLNLAPRHNKVIENLKYQVLKGEKIANWSVIIHHLGMVQPKFIKKEFSSLIGHSRDIDARLLDIAARNCFSVDKKWGRDVLNAMRDPHLWRQTFLNLYHLFGQDFINKSIDGFTEEETQFVLQDLAKIQRNSLTPRCKQ